MQPGAATIKQDEDTTHVSPSPPPPFKQKQTATQANAENKGTTHLQWQHGVQSHASRPARRLCMCDKRHGHTRDALQVGSQVGFHQRLECVAGKRVVSACR